MSFFDERSCRICLSPGSALVNVFGTFQKRSVEKIIFQVCQIHLSQDKRIPQSICELCISKLLLAESIKKLCTKNEKFLTDFAKISQAEILDVEPDIEQQKSSFEEKESEIFIEVIQEPTDDLFEVEFTAEEATQMSDTESICWEPLMQLNEKARTEASRTATNFYCTYCFQEFNTRAKCSYHEKTRHEPQLIDDDVKPFTCDRCGLKFKHKAHVFNHLNVVHLRIKRFQCKVCGFAMYSKTHHTTHMKTHSNIKEFKCEQCGKYFSRKEALFVHQRTHKNERPYICKFCDRSYTAHTDLKRHIFTHTGIHPYVCKLCSKGYFLKRMLYEHVNNEHTGIDTTSWLSGKTVHNF